MKAKLRQLQNKKWLLAVLFVSLLVAYPTYAYVSSFSRIEDGSDTTKEVLVPDSGPIGTNEKPKDADKKNSNQNTEPEFSSANEVAAESGLSQVAASQGEPPKTTKENKKQTEAAPTPKVVTYADGTSAWWVNKRWADFGYVNDYWGETCSSWRTEAQTDGVAVVAGPGLHRIICIDAASVSSFGFIEQVRTDGYVISAYNWAGEPGEKQLIMKTFNGYSFLAPKSK